jgi:hypothetical protein
MEQLEEGRPSGLPVRKRRASRGLLAADTDADAPAPAATAGPSLWRTRLGLLARRRPRAALVLALAGLALALAVQDCADKLWSVHLPEAPEHPQLGAPWARLYALRPSALVGAAFRSAGVDVLSVREVARECCEYGPVVFRDATWRERLTEPYGQGEKGLVDFSAVLRRLRDEAPTRAREGVGAGAPAVFVPTAMLGAFLRELFLQLRPEERVVLVTGNEDCGPAEVFGHGRSKCDARLPVALPELLRDPRLRHWVAQNWDLDGRLCARSPAAGDPRCSAPRLAPPELAKVSPLPLGLDLHTLAEKAPRARKEPAAAQQAALRRAAAQAAAWPDRPRRLLAVFSLDPDKPDRAALQRRLGLAARPGPDDGGGSDLEPCLVRGHSMGREEYWQLHAQTSFVLCPQGNGIDTHRVYEALLLGTVPVVRSSPLDTLYANFPIVVLAEWTELACANVDAWGQDVQRRFGQDPFQNPDVRRKLQTAYWVDSIKAYRA